MKLTESYKKRIQELSGILPEKFVVVQNTLEIVEPYDMIQKVSMGDKSIYILFGDVDYYENKESILAIKRKSNELNLNSQSYKNFLSEFKKRFNSIGELKNSGLIISVESTCPVNDDMANSLNLPYIKNGFIKKDSLFKMKDIKIKDRGNVKDLFNLNANIEGQTKICVMDDFITTGSTFKNAFDKLPNNVSAVGVCLFRLKS